MFLETRSVSIVVNLAGIGGMQNVGSTAIWCGLKARGYARRLSEAGALARRSGFQCPTGTR
jgi:hypothetical protein